jgi:hypothetical protein
MNISCIVVINIKTLTMIRFILFVVALTLSIATVESVNFNMPNSKEAVARNAIRRAKYKAQKQKKEANIALKHLENARNRKRKSRENKSVSNKKER